MLFLRERFIKVTDNWYPCYEGQRVKLRLSLNYFNYYYVKLAAWGADDTAYEIEYSSPSFKDVLEKYYELIPFYESIPNNIDKMWFINHGFKRF